MVKGLRLTAVLGLTALIAIGLTSTTLVSKMAPEVPSGAYKEINLNFGDVEPGVEIKTNAQGKYQSIILKENFKPHDVLKNKFVTDRTELKDFGYTTEDSKLAEIFLYELLTQDFIDSSAINGNEDDYTAWVAYLESTGKYSTDVIQTFKTNKTKGKSTVYFQDGVTAVPDFIYDKTPRVSDVLFEESNVTALEYDRTPYLQVTTKYSVLYRVADEELVNYVYENTKLTSKAELQSIVKPDLFDNYGENAFKVKGESTFQLAKNGENWVVIGFDMGYSFDDTSYKLLP